MQFTIISVIYLFLSCCLLNVEGRQFTSILSVTNGGHHGNWGKRKFCSRGYANRFSLKIHEQRGPFYDDTSLNGIRLYCTDGSTITSLMGRYGDWSDVESCNSGFLNSFALRVSAYDRRTDNTAADNIKFTCTDGTEVEGEGHYWGKYGSWSPSCRRGGGICGIQTRVDLTEKGSSRDLTELNDVMFFCCS